jgi:hypothetical protein
VNERRGRELKDEIVRGFADDIRRGTIANPELGGGALPDLEKVEKLVTPIIEKVERDEASPTPRPKHPALEAPASSEISEYVCDATWTPEGPVTTQQVPNVRPAKLAADPELERRLRMLLGRQEWAVRILTALYFQPTKSAPERELDVLQIVDESVKFFGPYKAPERARTLYFP